MPVLEISKGDGVLDDLARETVMSRMLFPRDDTKYYQYLAWSIIAKEVSNIAAEDLDKRLIKVPAYLLFALLEAPSFAALREQGLRDATGGQAAATLLEFILACHFHHPRFKPSVSKTWDVLSKHRREAKKQGFSVAFLKSQWTKFKPVVHLWTAQLLIGQAGGQRFKNIWKDDGGKGLRAMLGIAEALRKQARRSCQRAGGSPCLAPPKCGPFPPI